MRSLFWWKTCWITVSTVFLALAVLPARAAAVPFTPPWALDAVDRLKTLGVLPLWMGATRPLSVADLRAGLLEADERTVATLAPGDQVLLERLRHEAGVDTGSFTRPAMLQGGKLGLAYGVDRSYVSLAGAQVSDREWAAGWAVDSPTAGLLIHDGGSFYLGRERLGWGPSGEGGLLFSDAAGPFDRIQYYTAWQGFRYTKLVGWLDSGRSLEAVRLDWMVQPNMRIRLSEYILMLGGAYWLFVAQPIPMLNEIISNL